MTTTDSVNNQQNRDLTMQQLVGGIFYKVRNLMHRFYSRNQLNLRRSLPGTYVRIQLDLI
jgi:hypothetical protein